MDFTKKNLVDFVRKVRREFDFSGIIIGHNSKSTGRYAINKKLWQDFKEKYPGILEAMGEFIFLYNHLKKPKTYAKHRVCKVCGKRTPWVGAYYATGYQPHCSASCAQKDPEVSGPAREKAKETCLRKYGVDNVRKCPEIIEEIQRKRKQDMKKNPEKYEEARRKGIMSEESIAKRKAICKEKYGAETPFQSNNFQKRLQKSALEKVGSTTFCNTPQAKKKRHNTLIDRYGVDNAFKSEEIKEKIKESMIEKYGEDHPMKVGLIKAQAQFKLMMFNSSKEGRALRFKRNIKIRKETYEKDKKILLEDCKIKPLFTKKEYLDIDSKLRFQCLSCNEVFSANVGYRMTGVRCPECSKYRHTSRPEIKVRSWMERIGLTPRKVKNKIQNPATNRWLEIDMFCKKQNLGVELHGTYWHSAKDESTDNKQKLKYLLCKEKGIRLIQIFEHEWWDDRKRKILKGLIRRAAGLTKSSKTAYARKCELVSVSTEKYRKFLDKNHIQGFIGAAVKLGLEYEGKLVAVASFGNSRFKKGETELIRFCIKNGWNVVGGLSRLVKNYVREYKPKKLISYVDARLFDGKGYLSAGFKQVGHSKPNYFYEKHGETYSRMKFQKHKLEKELDMYKEDLSEYENMVLNGYRRLFDAGNLKMEYDF